MAKVDEKELIDVLLEAKSSLNDFCCKLDCEGCPRVNSKKNGECDNDRLIEDITRIVAGLEK